MKLDDATELARRIAKGHAWAAHHAQFQDLDTIDAFIELIASILVEATDTRVLPRDRTAYWHDDSGTIVILDPNDPDGGTAFRPDHERVYFETVM